MSQELAASVPALLRFLPGEGGGRPGGRPALPFAAAQLSVGTIQPLDFKTFLSAVFYGDLSPAMLLCRG